VEDVAAAHGLGLSVGLRRRHPRGRWLVLAVPERPSWRFG
jgi:hypothetical protein